MNSIELENRIRAFALRVVKLCEAFPAKKISGIIQYQLLRSSFSAAANIEQHAEGLVKRLSFPN